ncbi:hypothetical protein FRB96_006902 [Tulasnella sp. 330]|nr:hypothetical protein FRB96_006902 [Tulasnella sp. 330]
MIYYTVFTVYDVIKTLFGYRSHNASLKIASGAVLVASPQALEHTEAGDDDRRSIQSWQSVGNGATKKAGHAILRGSPKALGWNVDETEEENAWTLLMGDALEGSVYERSNAGDDEEVIISPIAPSNQDILKFFSAEQDRGVTYVWKIVPSLTGAHQWTLQRQGGEEEVPQEPEVARETVEMQTDTTDLVEHSHQETGTQTTVKTYCDAAVQVEEPEAAIPAGALSPLPESTDLVDVLPADLRPVTPSMTAIDSRSSTPDNSSRIPRLISRRGSVASFQSASSRAGTSSPVLTAVARAGSTSPVPIASFQKPTRASSIRSMALRRASSKLSLNPTLPVDTSEVGEAAPAEKKKVTGRFFDAVKKISRTDAAVKAWKP